MCHDYRWSHWARDVRQRSEPRVTTLKTRNPPPESVNRPVAEPSHEAEIPDKDGRKELVDAG